MKPNLKLVKLKVSSQQRIAERIEPESLMRAYLLARYQDQRGEIVSAFVKHRHDPDEVVLVVQRVDGATEIFHITREERDC